MSFGHCCRWTTAWPSGLLAILTFGRLCCAEPCIGSSCPATAASLLAVKAEAHLASVGHLEDQREYPINMTVNGSNGTVDKQLEMIVGENAEQDMKEMNNIPNPENASSTLNQNTTFVGSCSKSPLGCLQKSWFCVLKVMERTEWASSRATWSS